MFLQIPFPVFSVRVDLKKDYAWFLDGESEVAAVRCV